MEEKKPLKIKFKTAIVLIIIGAIILTIFGANVYASKHGYDNIFFLIKYKITGENEKITDRDKLLIEDDDKKAIESQKEDTKFSDEEVKKSFQKYLDLVGAKWLESYDILIKLDLIKESDAANFKQASTEGYLKTNIKYFEFKNKMLNYVTENCFENDIIVFDSTEHKAYINEDGYLCCANSGSSGGNYKVQSITKINDKQYMAKVIHTLEEGEEDINYNFGIENNNGKCVIDYCREILSDKSSIENESLKNLQDVALEWKNINEIKNYKLFIHDLDKDNINDIVRVKTINNTTNNETNYIVELNGTEVIDETRATLLSKIYIVDLNKNDNKIEIVLEEDSGSDDPVYSVYVKNKNTLNKIIFEDGFNLKTNENGIIVAENKITANITPIFYENVFEVKNGIVTKKETNIEDYKNTTFSSEYLYFTQDMKNISKYFENENTANYTLENAGIYTGKFNFKILKIKETMCYYVRLDDGREGYLFSLEGYLAG